MNSESKYNSNKGDRIGLPNRRSIRLKGYDYSKAGLYFITICCQDHQCRFGHVENGEMKLNGFGRIAFDEWKKLADRFTNFQLDVFQIMPNHMHGIISLVGASLADAPKPTKTDAQNAPKTDAQNAPKTDARNAPKTDARNATKTDARNATKTDARNATKTDARNATKTDAMESPKTNVANYGGSRTGASPAPTAHTIGDMVGAYKSLVANGCLKIYKSKNETMGKLWQRNYYEIIIRNEQAYQRISEYIINNPAKWSADKFYK